MTRTYDTFGNLVHRDGTEKSPIGFQSKYMDSESGLYYFYHRYYNPFFGKFITEDPIGMNGGINMYSFVFNNPIYLIDHFGLNSDVLTYGWIIALEEPSPVGEIVMTVVTIGYIVKNIFLSKTIEKGRTWLTEDVKKRARRENKNECDILRQMMEQACKKDKKYIREIKKAMKFLGCANIQKRNSD